MHGLMHIVFVHKCFICNSYIDPKSSKPTTQGCDTNAAIDCEFSNGGPFRLPGYSPTGTVCSKGMLLNRSIPGCTCPTPRAFLTFLFIAIIITTQIMDGQLGLMRTDASWSGWFIIYENNLCLESRLSLPF